MNDKIIPEGGELLVLIPEGQCTTVTRMRYKAIEEVLHIASNDQKS